METFGFIEFIFPSVVEFFSLDLVPTTVHSLSFPPPALS